MPRILGVLMAIAGLGWLTYLSMPFQNYILAVDLLGEGSVMLWLLVMGVDEQRWNEQAGATGASILTGRPQSTSDTGSRA